MNEEEAKEKAKEIITKMLDDLHTIDDEYWSQAVGAAINSLVMVLMLAARDDSSLEEIEKVIIENSVRRVRLAVEIAQAMGARE